MKWLKIQVIIGLIVFVSCSSKELYGIKAPFNRGVNLTMWFQVDSPQQIQFSKYTRTDFEQIKSLGCDAVRLPINLHYMTNGEPDYTIDPLFFNFLDQVVGWCEELGIHLIIDNHTFDVTTDTDPAVGTILEKVWTQMATQYLNTSTKIYYEVLNEPHGIEDSTWNAIQQKAVAAIRAVDTKHTIVIGPASWNNYNNLNAMPVYSDTNLIYTFHFYDPFLFTHQGASWTILGPAKNIPFPYSAEEMPSLPAGLIGTWGESTYIDYKNAGTEQKVREWIDIAANFSESRNVPVWCGEFGVYDANCPYDDRTYWYEIVRKHLEEKEISWTIWDYHGAFGLFEKDSEGYFEHDLNIPVLQALGLNVPEQTPYSQTIDSSGFIVYDDFLGRRINDASNNPGTLSFYSTDHPNNGDYCISWSGGAHYQGIAFDFKPNRDLSYLVENGYALSIQAKTDNPNGQFDIRYIDTKTDDPTDHPWRIRKTVNKSLLPGDNQWHSLYFPLAEFEEHGAWDNAWYNPEGKFDWKAIDRLEISLEYEAMENYSFWFDEIAIAKKDTLDPGEPIGKNNFTSQRNFAKIQVFTANKQVEIENFTQSGAIQYRLVDVTGKSWSKGSFENQIVINTEHFPAGFYMLHLQKRDEGTMVRKILLN
jgi:endoglucanase